MWVNRRAAIGAEHLSVKQWVRLGQMLDDHDSTGEIGAG